MNKACKVVSIVLGFPVLLAAHASFAKTLHIERIPVRLVVVTTFEVGKDTGDKPGELQPWVEKLPLPIVFSFPQGWWRCRADPMLPAARIPMFMSSPIRLRWWW